MPERPEGGPVTVEHLVALADAMPQLVWAADAQGRVDYYNRRVESYGGWEVQDGRYDWQPLVHPDDLGLTTERWSGALQTGSGYECEHRVLMADGTYRWHLSRALPLRDVSGAIVRWVGTATDVHSQKLVEHGLEEIAQALQRALLPTTLPQTDLDLAVRYRPARDENEVGGDWYDAVAAGRSLCLVIGDVAGHGVDAAAAMGACRHAVSFALRSGRSPADALRAADDYVAALHQLLITCCVVALDPDAGVARFATAGHPPPVLVAGGAASLVPVEPAPPLGAGWDGLAPTLELEFGRRAGDTLVLYTDGLVERRGESLDEGFDRLLRQLHGASAQADAIADDLMAQFAETASDDVALVVVRSRRSVGREVAVGAEQQIGMDGAFSS